MIRRREPFKTKGPGGRPRKELNYRLLDKLCELQCTGEEAASVLELNYETLNIKLKEETGMNFREYFKFKSGKGRVSLRRAQWRLAKAGNPAMQIWLGKQYLEQREPSNKIELTGAEGGPIQHDFDNTKIKAAFSELYRE